MNPHCARPETLREAAETIKRAIAERMLTIILATCETSYEGRAASHGTPGDLTIIVKPDGALLVHAPHGYKPQNWQPQTKTITVDVKDDALIIRAVRERPREILTLKCGKPHAIISWKPSEKPQHYMYLSEHEIRDTIARDPTIIEEGLHIVRVEKPVDPGFIDLYARDKNGRLVIIELKRVKAGEAAVRQLLRYAEALRRKGHENPRLILAAPDFTEAAITLAAKTGVELARIDLQKLWEKTRQSKTRRPSLEDYL